MAMTLRDPNQIVTSEHDEQNNAKRVIIVGGEIPEFKMPDLSNLKLSGGSQIQKIEVPVIVKEVQLEKIEVPVVIKEIEIREIEKPIPVVIKEIHVERVEVPIVVKEYETIQSAAQVKEITQIEKMPKWAMGIILVQSLIATMAILLNLLK